MDEWRFKPGWVVPEWLMQRCTEIIWKEFFLNYCNSWYDREDFFDYDLHLRGQLSCTAEELRFAVEERNNVYWEGGAPKKYAVIVLDCADWAELHRRMEEKLNG